MEDLKKKPLNEIIPEMTRLEQEIDLMVLRYEKLRLEVIRRFPHLENEAVFKQKVKEMK